MGHARALLAIEDNNKRLTLAQKIIEDKLSVRDIERTIQKSTDLKQKKHKDIKSEAKDPNISETINKLQYKFGTPVELIKKSGERGVLKIEFFSENDLIRIVDLLLSGS
jgi:ParB family chromosome partitioning protein